MRFGKYSHLLSEKENRRRIFGPGRSLFGAGGFGFSFSFGFGSGGARGRLVRGAFGSRRLGSLESACVVRERFGMIRSRLGRFGSDSDRGSGWVPSRAGSHWVPPAMPVGRRGTGPGRKKRREQPRSFPPGRIIKIRNFGPMRFEVVKKYYICVINLWKSNLQT